MHPALPVSFLSWGHGQSISKACAPPSNSMGAIDVSDEIRIRGSFLQRITSETRIILKAPHSRAMPAVAPPGHY